MFSPRSPEQKNLNAGIALIRTLAITILLFLGLSKFASGEIDFVRDVRPVLKQHCYACHSETKQKSGLRLDIKSEAFKGGEIYGPSIIAGDPKESPLIQFVSDPDADLPMPPDGDRLTAAEIKTLSAWVEQGANWPDGVDEAELKDLTDHWSFRPVTRPQVPEPRNSKWCTNDIDAFVLAKLEESNLSPSPKADRTAWLRRVHFDLIGLPPTVKQVDAFLNDKKPGAYERIVDRLLASPRYGERWAQHWLDVVRYADTHGFEVNTERPNAWPYRDYVIRAFNNDKPYDQFVREQIVGDAMGQDPATGFLVTASVLLPGQIGKDEPSIRLARQDAIDEIVVNLGQSFLGLSIGCARCHDHKFDPVSQEDYYAMQAFVAGVEYGEREIVTPELRELQRKSKLLKERLAIIDGQLVRFEPLAKSGQTRSPVNAAENIDRFQTRTTRAVRFQVLSTNKYEPCLDEIEILDVNGKNTALASAGTTVTSSGDKVSPNRHELRFVNDGQYGNSRSWMSDEVGKGWVQLTFSEPMQVNTVIWGRDRQGKFSDRLAIEYRIEVVEPGGTWTVVADATDRKTMDANENPQKKVTSHQANQVEKPQSHLNQKERATLRQLLAEKASLEAEIQRANNVPKVFAGKFRKPDQIHFLARGNPELPKQLVPPAVPVALGDLSLPGNAPEQQRRNRLAQWITDETNPLTARVMVNRIWQLHFGTGLVETPNDFGHAGALPSHPKLLDWLASEFVRSGWSIKQMHRLIVLSSTYRQSTSFSQSSTDVGSKIDAEVRLLWKFPTRRMDAETIRDSMLATSGNLNLKMYGPGFNLFDKRGGLTGFRPVANFTGDGLRRMVYAHKVRRETDAVFGAFDCPDAGQSTPRRRESTTPIQSLNLFNSPFTLDASRRLASRINTDVGNEPLAQIDLAYRILFSRQPTELETGEAASVVRQHGLATLCRVLFNSNEFLFIP